jgi:ribosome-associated protein
LGLESREKALEIARLALARKADDVKVLDLRELVSFTEFFVICSGESTQKVKAIVENIEDGLSGLGIKPLGTEGRTYGHWVLIDYDDVVVHVFEGETRGYYELEKLWLDAPSVPVDEGKDNLGRKDKRKAHG